MIIEIKVHATADQISIQAPQAKIKDKFPNVVAYLERGKLKTVVAIGKTADDLQCEAPERWARDKERVSFAHPFDAASFEPVLACAVLDYYAQGAFVRIRPGLLTRWLGRAFDRFRFDVHIKDYDQLPAKTRTQFERLLRKQLQARILSINGQVIK